MVGVLLASPYIFLSNLVVCRGRALSTRKKYVNIFLPFSLGLFLAGAALAFFFVFEPVLDFLFRFNELLGIDIDPRISEWLSFVLVLPLGFGISFQLPLVMLFLERIGIFFGQNLSDELPDRHSGHLRFVDVPDAGRPVEYVSDGRSADVPLLWRGPCCASGCPKAKARSLRKKVNRSGLLSNHMSVARPVTAFYDAVLGRRFMTPSVQGNRRNDNRAGQNLLDPVRQPHLRTTGTDNAHDQRPDDRPGNRPFTAA